MSCTGSDKVSKVLGWLEKNAFWNREILSVENSVTTSGVGVFLKGGTKDDDNLLLRIPKANILSSKNSFICNLLIDFQELYSVNVNVNLTKGMHSAVISFIYELAAGEKSPWYDYISTINPTIERDDLSNVPICLWSDEEKEMLKNTECDLLGMLNSSELTQFYIECIRFAHINEKLVGIPAVFDFHLPDDPIRYESFIMENHFYQLILFAKYVQTVISRAFGVDEYHGLSLVPGADLFNHIVPILVCSNGNTRIQGRENVHFVCDGEDACALCGEINCENHEQDAENNEESIEEMDYVEEEIGEAVEYERENDEEEEEGGHDLEMADFASGSSDSESENEYSADENNELSETEEIDDVPEITLEYIKEMEQEIKRHDDSDAETARSDEEVSTLSLSEDENAVVSKNAPPISHSVSEEEELALQLSDSSQCCDIILTNPPLKEHNYELFNTYGNTLSNPFLLQRYGFVNDVKQPNVNDSCILSVQMFSYIKNYKQNNSRAKVKQLDAKLDWYEEVGFEIVNDLVSNYKSEDEEENDNHKHENSDDCCIDLDEDVTETLPETWQLSPVVRYDGSISPQTYALLKIILIPYRIFQAKLLNCGSNRKLCKRVFHLLLPFENDSHDDEIHQIIRSWCQSRLARYNDNTSMRATTKIREKIIADLIKQEQSILKNAIDKLSSK